MGTVALGILWRIPKPEYWRASLTSLLLPHKAKSIGLVIDIPNLVNIYSTSAPRGTHE